jgi:hypothetical protein
MLIIKTQYNSYNEMTIMAREIDNPIDYRTQRNVNVYIHI